MGLEDLPVEILNLILQGVSPPDTFNVHLVCRSLALKTRTAVSGNRDKAKELYIQSDVHPLTVPSLLRRILYHDQDVWHIQRLEFWGYRPSWDYWTEHRDLRRHFPWLNIDYSRHAFFFSDTELDMLKKICTKTLGMTTFRANNWIEEVKAGNDGPMKVMLITLLPRLKRLVFVPAPVILDQSTWHYVLELLSQYIRMRHNPSFSAIGMGGRIPDWPHPGLAARTKINRSTRNLCFSHASPNRSSRAAANGFQSGLAMYRASLEVAESHTSLSAARLSGGGASKTPRL